jgi:transcriptional regulator GlxA family with amidase domain
MYQAANLLAKGRIALPALASSVGYRSEVSFGKAFKRWAGRSPAEYRRWLSQRTRNVIKAGIEA